MNHWYSHWIWPVLSLVIPLLKVLTSWTPRFPRAWRTRRVSIGSYGHVYTCRISELNATTFIAYNVDALHDWSEGISKSKIFRYSPMPGHRYEYKDEGLTWCFGWEGPQVDALRVTAAFELES